MDIQKFKSVEMTSECMGYKKTDDSNHEKFVLFYCNIFHLNFRIVRK